MVPTTPHVDEQLMRRAIALAMRGRGGVEPNPMVGCVIANQGRVIGEGFHQRFGGPHAEPNALAACIESPVGATAYVSLEPCCHLEKKTPPCVPKLIQAGIARVVIGCLDPNPQVSGRGAEQLRKAGIEVSTSVIEPQAKQLVAPFFRRVIQNAPYVTLKWAESANRKVAGTGGKTIWITNPRSTRLVHELRSRCDAILVGINTAIADDPLLTVRGVESQRPLVRALLDSRLRLSLTSRLVKTANFSPIILFCSLEAYERGGSNRVLDFEKAGVRVVPLSTSPNTPGPKQLSLADLLSHLDATHLLVEPGPTLAASFINEGLADRLWVFRSRVSIDEPGAIPTADVNYPHTGVRNLDGDELTEYLNPSSSAFFAMEQSADFRLIDGTSFT